jgi:hypothetical protein
VGLPSRVIPDSYGPVSAKKRASSCLTTTEGEGGEAQAANVCFALSMQTEWMVATNAANKNRRLDMAQLVAAAVRIPAQLTRCSSGRPLSLRNRLFVWRSRQRWGCVFDNSLSVMEAGDQCTATNHGYDGGNDTHNLLSLIQRRSGQGVPAASLPNPTCQTHSPVGGIRLSLKLLPLS